MLVNLPRTEAVILTIQPPVASFQLLKHPCILISTIQPSPMGYEHYASIEVATM